jgi:hypothetical protein
MRLLRLTAVALVLCLSAPVVTWAGREPKLPRAIDSPLLRPKVQEGHKAQLRQGRHPSKYWDTQWGRNQSFLTQRHSRPTSPYLR